MTHRILLVDDDIELCELLSEYLRKEGLDVAVVHDGLEAVQHLQECNAAKQDYDALVLDFMLPGMQGLDILQRLRAFSNTPVLMLTARGDDIDRIVGLEAGADDYLPKPCNPRELLARLRAVLRRTENQPAASSKSTLSSHGIELDTGQRTSTVNDQHLELTSAEFNALAVLLAQQGNIVSKEDLTQLALNREYTRYDRSVDVHISSIRKKLAQFLPDVELIKTVRGSGYIFINEADA